MDKIAIVDFGGQYTHLIANRIRRLGVFSEILSPDTEISLFNDYKGIIFSGSPHSVTDNLGPVIDQKIFNLDKPILGLCYGHQLIVKLLGGFVNRGSVREYGKANLVLTQESDLFRNLEKQQQIWMSHGDTVQKLPQGFELIGSTEDCTYAAVMNKHKKIYGLQFHPEVTDTPQGMSILDNFIDICNCERNWNTQAFLKEIINEIQQKCAGKKVFLLVSGGVDSTVAFTLLNKALGTERVFGLHIDNGLMRYEESDAVIAFLKQHGYDNLHVYNAEEDFLEALHQVSDPEEKRTIIGNTFIEVKEKAQMQLQLSIDEWILAQGTIYPDTIESAGTKHADKIKTHHNRVDCIMELIENGLIIEPLAQLYKDEVRELGKSLKISPELLWRHPFPGPGLGVRILCSQHNKSTLDAKVIHACESIASASGYQAYVLPVRSVGVQGDCRSYAHPVLLVGKKDWNVLERISTQITNSVSGINRVVWGVSINTKPEYSLIQTYLTKDRLDLLRSFDHAVTQILHDTGEYNSIWQMPVVLLPLVNKNDDQCVVLRPIVSQEAMTARFRPLKEETLKEIVNQSHTIKGIGDLFFDITHKPPGTIEWE